MKKMFLLPLLVLSVNSFAATTAYNYGNAGGGEKTDGLANAVFRTTCDSTDTSKARIKPLAQKLKLFQVYLCKDAPAKPNDGEAIDLSSCSAVFDSSGGVDITIQDGVSVTLSEADTFYPPNGTYNYYFLKTGKDFQYKAEMDFGPAEGVNQYCWTNNATQDTTTKLAAVRSCGAAMGVADWMTEEKTAMPAGAMFIGYDVANPSVGAYILNGDDTWTDVGTLRPSPLTYYGAIRSFNSPVTISESTTNFGMTVDTKRAFFVMRAPSCGADNWPKVGTTSLFVEFSVN